MGGRTLGIALGRRSISNKILVDYFVTRERPLYYFSLKLCSLLCIGDSKLTACIMSLPPNHEDFVNSTFRSNKAFV